MAKTNKEFLDYYFREIDYLKHAGSDFAKEFPKVAGRLNFDGNETSDPHIARLLESFAFLTAKAQHHIDNVAASLTNALIDVLYPHLNRQLPAMSIARFIANEGGNKPPPIGFPVSRGTNLFAYASNDSVCRFTTVFPLTLFPIKITKIAIVPSITYKFVPIPNTADFGYKNFQNSSIYCCEITLECLAGEFSGLSLEKILFHINIEDEQFKKQFYKEVMSNNSLIYCVRGNEEVASPMLPQSVKKMGFEREEMAIPSAGEESHSYQLLQEFFHFSEKFMFFTIDNLNFLKYLRKGTFLNTKQIKFLIPLKDANSEWTKKIFTDNLRIDSTPIVNLYHTITDPIPLDEKRVFYHIMPNAYKDRTMEIYRIDKVFCIDSTSGEHVELSPYFTFINASQNQNVTDNMFWWAKTVPTHHENITGFNTEISFVDLDFNILNPSEQVVYAKALCTNRFLAEDLRAGTKLNIEQAAPVDEIICTQTPIAPQYSLEKGQNNTKLISQLAVNYLGFPYNQNSNIKDILAKILMMHVSPARKSHAEKILQDVDSISVSHTTRRIGQDAWRGIVDGVQVTINIKSKTYEQEWYLLSIVLQQYFAMNCQINTFVELSLNLNEVEIAKLNAVSGERLFI
ncbi:MAG: type VI secretion system baseplate subunit TssF [Holosporales bacterium]|nr:type VI secretion system baseplate subunit TssF [Holosporales bacterium]